MIKTIYLAGGCFWGTAHLFSLVPGVQSARAGYANSVVASPTYEEVCTGRTQAAETVEVTYDDAIVGLTTCCVSISEALIRCRSTGKGATQARNTAPVSITPTRPTALS